MAEIAVYDMEGNKKDFAYAKAKYGVAFRRAEVAEGQKVYRLVELWEKTGHNSLITQVLDEDGHPMANVDMAFYWPDAPDPPDPPTQVYAHDWYKRFVHGLTNVNGDVGPAMGKGAYHGEGEGGPHAVWVRDPNIPSDICERLGMLAGTFHDHLDQVFQLKEGGQEPMSKGKFVEIEDARTVKILPPEGVNENHVSVKCEGEPNFYDTRVDLRVGSDWKKPDWIDPNPHHPAGLHHYNIPTRYKPVSGELSRVFWVLIRHAGTEALVSDPLSFGYNKGEGRQYATKVKWLEDVTPPPGDGELLAVAQKILAITKETQDSVAAIKGMLTDGATLKF